MNADRRADEEERFVEVQLDYTLAVEDGRTLTILTVRFATTGWSAATVVSQKGPGRFAVQWATATLRGAGSQP